MAKINPKYENPIDNFIVFELCEPISDYLYNESVLLSLENLGFNNLINKPILMDQTNC